MSVQAGRLCLFENCGPKKRATTPLLRIDNSTHHGLQRDARRVAIEVGIDNKVLKGLQDLLEELSLGETSLEHDCLCVCVERKR